MCVSAIDKRTNVWYRHSRTGAMQVGWEKNMYK